MNKQLFFSHTWRLDNLNRHTHERVAQLVHGLQKYGWTTWFDEDDMIGNIDAAMASGIDQCDCVLVCLTEQYCIKVNTSAKDPYIHDNCEKEWNYANNRDKLMLPIILDSTMLNTAKWPPGVVPLYLSSILYVDATAEDLTEAIENIHKRLLQYKLQPHNNNLSEEFFKINIKTSAPTTPTISPINSQPTSRSRSRASSRGSSRCSSRPSSRERNSNFSTSPILQPSNRSLHTSPIISNTAHRIVTKTQQYNVPTLFNI